VCPDCLDALAAPAGPAPTVPGLRGCASLLGFEGRGRDLVVALKYGNARGLGHLLGTAMATLVDPSRIDVVTWAPTSASRRGRRGYDQSRLLAVAAGRALGRPCRLLLRRGPGPPQTGRNLAQRQVGPRFAAIRPGPARVLLVDDVVTTGATLAAAAHALHQAGTEQVWGLTAASTPARVPALPAGRAPRLVSDRAQAGSVTGRESVQNRVAQPKRNAPECR